jgi:hypothetical protein
MHRWKKSAYTNCSWKTDPTVVIVYVLVPNFKLFNVLCINTVTPELESGCWHLALALRVVRGDGKGTQCPGVYLGHPVPGGYKYGDLTPQVGGVSRIGTIKCGLESRGTALARTSTNSKLQTRPLVREGATK